MSQVLSSALTNAQYNFTRGCANGLPQLPRLRYFDVGSIERFVLSLA
ncbi:MAG: hypothetical protein V7K40_19265 [Nostoc sp.]